MLTARTQIVNFLEMLLDYELTKGTPGAGMGIYREAYRSLALERGTPSTSSSDEQFSQAISDLGIKQYADCVEDIVRALIGYTKCLDEVSPSEALMRFVDEEPLPGMLPANPYVSPAAARQFVVAVMPYHHADRLGIEYQDLFGMAGTLDLRGIVVEHAEDMAHQGVRIHLMLGTCHSKLAGGIIKCLSIDPTGITTETTQGGNAQHFANMGLYVPDESGTPEPNNSAKQYLTAFRTDSAEDEGLYFSMKHHIDKLAAYIRSCTAL